MFSSSVKFQRDCPFSTVGKSFMRPAVAEKARALATRETRVAVRRLRENMVCFG